MLGGYDLLTLCLHEAFEALLGSARDDGFLATDFDFAIGCAFGFAHIFDLCEMHFGSF